MCIVLASVQRSMNNLLFVIFVIHFSILSAVFITNRLGNNKC